MGTARNKSLLSLFFCMFVDTDSKEWFGDGARRAFFCCQNGRQWEMQILYFRRVYCLRCHSARLDKIKYEAGREAERCPSVLPTGRTAGRQRGFSAWRGSQVKPLGKANSRAARLGSTSGSSTPPPAALGWELRGNGQLWFLCPREAESHPAPRSCLQTRG